MNQEAERIKFRIKTTSAEVLMKSFTELHFKKEFLHSKEKKNVVDEERHW